MDGRIDVGRRGEAAAEARYVAAGYRVVARNWRCSVGELDLVLVRGNTLVICEVKTRRGSRFGGGYEAVDGRKRRSSAHWRRCSSSGRRRARCRSGSTSPACG